MLVSVGVEHKLTTAVLAVLMCIAHVFHFWYFAIRTSLGSPCNLYVILTGPHCPMFWPAPLVIAYSAASVAYTALLWFTYTAVAIASSDDSDDDFGIIAKVTLILFWSIFVYFYTDRLVSDVFVIKFKSETVGQAVYTSSLLLAFSASMYYSGLLQSLTMQE